MGHQRSRDTPRAEVVFRNGRRELRIDGTFASAYDPDDPTTGSVWDAIASGVLAVPPERRKRILLLGLGGGSAARIVRAVAPSAQITGVEIDASVVKLARRWFDLDALGVETVIDDARTFMAQTRKHFDLILEDCFIGHEAELAKPEGMPEPLFSHAARRLRPGGVVVSNTLDESTAVAKSLRSHFPRVVEVGIDGYDNRVLVGGPKGTTGAALRRAVAADPILGATLPVLSFRTR